MRRIVPMVLFAAMLLGLCGCAASPVPLTATLLRVGKADAIVLRCAGQILVIDTGEADDGPELLRCLDRLGAERVDVLILTHFDRDHIGGAARLCERMPIGRVLLPACAGSGEEYLAFVEAAGAAGLSPERLSAPLSFSFGSCRVLVEPPGDCENRSDNNCSLIVAVEHGALRLVFAGDAEKQRIREYLAGDGALPCDFLKVPHHGVWNAALQELFSQLRPKVAVICDSDKNPAEEKTLAQLEKLGAAVYETRFGTVTVESDGRKLSVRQG